jgi:hypothetical protein
MIDTRLQNSKGPSSPGKEGDTLIAPLSTNGSAEPEQDESGRYFVLAPDGTTMTIPKELYVALSDFMKTRKCPGSITIQFRAGGIVCVEAVAKKTFRSPANTLA